MLTLILSDIHGRERKLREVLSGLEDHVDLILISGDLTNFGSVEEARRILRCFTKPFFYVLGNCDPIEGLGGILGFEDRYLHGRALTHGGVCLAGISGSGITPFNTNIEYSEQEFRRMHLQLKGALSACRAKALVMVTHEPPADSRLDLTSRGVHAGSKSIRGIIEDLRPCLAICGHIHEGRGVDEVEAAVVVNPGPAMHGYYALANIDESAGRVVDVELRETR